ncbi:hypothetical protein Kpol_1073p8 [Vanderwaltozyma polyspora DSM 70294]|uniref:Uncharacterized protein n=1 Tax=Vanderwaltozyma polyspora (strain ATCC 22028 / DSM 70294 / BCRC 21397 / CBS 2163 / NBRC 10782 / NRRL Y-8283 / UCD 57-17) TaxID=436907 RepID=A7TPS1_VANPO|nr:uncharacterized protein Kpol_1073p8 [Vanderwaltozyma polyspora DSM 70294]EDO15722.1 hypothetical protein Kpol_1073p8 [Vanderwaltozyma polyspora DSM 70294]
MFSNPSTRLRDAIIEGNLLIVKRLLRRFPELLTNIDSSNGWSSLHYASYYGRYLICVFLIQMGHDRHEILKTFDGDTCVHLALMNGYEQTTHLLLQHFPQFIDKKGSFGRTPAHIACMHDYHQCLSLLVGVGAKLFLPDCNGDTPLHICLEFGSVNCMRLLVLETENIDDQIRNNDNWRPSDVAITFEMMKLYKKLLKESKASGVTKKTSLQSFRTPILPQKTAFEDGPSPILSINSPSLALFSQSNQLPPLPRISTSRKSSFANNAKSPIVRDTSFISMLASVDTSLSSPINSVPKKDYNITNPIERNSTETSSEISPRKNDSNGSKEKLEADTGLSNTIMQSASNSNLFSRYLNLKHTNENDNPVITPAVSDHRPDTRKGQILTSSSTNNSFLSTPRRKLSLLNIPVSKLREDKKSNSEHEKARSS